MEPVNIGPKEIIDRIHARPLEFLLVVLGIFFIYALWLGMLSLVYVIFTFVVIVLIDYQDYLEIPGNRDTLTMGAGATLIAAGLFMDSAVNRLLGYSTDDSLGATDFIPLLIGLLVFLYGFEALREYFVPLGISLSFLFISIIPTTSWGEHIHEPFVNFSVEGAMRLMELTEYHVTNHGAEITMIKPGTEDQIVEVD